MKFELWQALLHFTSFTVILCILFAKLLPMDLRVGMTLTLLGVLVSLGSWTLPSPKLREHVPNDRQLRRWGDILAYGLPASFLVWIGSTFLLGSIIYWASGGFGFLVGLVFLAGYCVWVFTRDDDG